MKQDNPYEIFADEYEAWFSENHHLFMSEVEAIRRLIPEFEKGIEVGVGTGLFAQKLGIKEGVEPSSAMRAKAESRGIVTYNAAVENLKSLIPARLCLTWRTESRVLYLALVKVCLRLFWRASYK